MTAVFGIDIAQSLLALDRQDVDGAVKVWEDLDRYRVVIERDQPEVIVECGTYLGGSARWFAAQGVDVVSIDNCQRCTTPEDRIRWIAGNSVDHAIVEQIRNLTTGRRTMVVLDSDHSAAHVAAEIENYGPLVSVGCHLVVEDAIIRYVGDEHPYIGTPMDAIEQLLIGNPNWIRDTDVEHLHSVSMHPAGWWIRAH